MLLSIGLCEDELAQTEYLTGLLNKWAEQHCHSVHIREFPSAERFWSAYEDGYQCDLLLLDIEMPGQNGMALAKQLRKKNDRTQIIFITGYSEFMADGYDVEALHYLLKPVSGESLYPVLDRAAERLQHQKPTLLITVDGMPVKIGIDDILYAEVFSHSVVIHTTHGNYTTVATIGKFSESLGKDFCRCHRSYLVNLARIRQVQKTELILENGETVPVSRRMAVSVTEAFFRYYREEAGK